MYRVFQQRLTQLSQADRKGTLSGGKKGIEKESLRVDREGEIAQTPHPSSLGSALTHPYITTDYSEALLEFITPPFADVRETFQFLCDIHQFVYANLTSDEILWATSMPCVLDEEHGAPIARYGHSNVGTMKHVYRRGLEYRYGGAMQAISGVHFNYSLPDSFWPVFQTCLKDDSLIQDFISNSYFCLVRNFQRLGWLIPYLFGTSPAVCRSFLRNRPAGFAEFDAGTYFRPHATSLRMSDIGYKDKTQANLKISYNHLDEYVASLTRAIETPYPEYEQIGVVVDGEYRQLNANILQIENEFYSFVRPKQIARSGEKPTLALKRRGVQYVEVRALDVDAFGPLGVNEDQLRFLEAFLIFCLLQESPAIDPDEWEEFDYNQRMVASYGRDPSLALLQHGQKRSLRKWAKEICEMMQGVCELLDESDPSRPYAKAVSVQAETADNPEGTPSARVLAEMWKAKESFFAFAMRMSEKHERYFKGLKMSAKQQQHFEQVTQQSLTRQREIEESDEISFEEYLKRYFAQS